MDKTARNRTSRRTTSLRSSCSYTVHASRIRDAISTNYTPWSYYANGVFTWPDYSK